MNGTSRLLPRGGPCLLGRSVQPSSESPSRIHGRAQRCGGARNCEESRSTSRAGAAGRGASIFSGRTLLVCRTRQTDDSRRLFTASERIRSARSDVPKAAAGISGVDGIPRSLALSLPEQEQHRPRWPGPGRTEICLRPVQLGVPDRGCRQTGRTAQQQRRRRRQAYTTPGRSCHVGQSRRR